MEEYVVLVNEKNEIIGTAEKLKTHNKQTPLHRGISVFPFLSKRNTDIPLCNGVCLLCVFNFSAVPIISFFSFTKTTYSSIIFSLLIVFPVLKNQQFLQQYQRL